MMISLFMSYSRKDELRVNAIVKLLRLTGSSVFLDSDCIEPGKKWRFEISRAIEDTDKMLVFWSRHSSVSNEVRNEYKMGIDAGCDVVPLLLDDSPLNADLNEYQYIDFRPLFVLHDPAGIGLTTQLLRAELVNRLIS